MMCFETGSRAVSRSGWRTWRRLFALAALAAAPANAIEILEAADHAELSADVSSREVNRIALEGDRIASAVPSSDAFAVEHDPVRGDLYLHPGGVSASPLSAFGAADSGAADAPAGTPAPMTLYLGTEKGFTYRLTLTPGARGSAQILIRNRSLAREAPARERAATPAALPEAREQALARLVGAAARGEPPAGYIAVRVPDFSGAAPGKDGSSPFGALIEIWRGPAFTARVFALPAGAAVDAETLAEAHGPGVAAVWLSPGDAGAASPHAGKPARLAVVVEEHTAAEVGR